MRDFKGMKRQRSRNRGGGNGGKPQQNANRAFESNGPEGVKIRGAAQHVFEKYQQLARDALTAGDRVLAEGYQQHAEHYFRLLRAMQPNRPASDIIGRDAFVSGYDLDFEDESGGEASGSSDAPEAEGERQDNQWRQQDANRYESRDRYQNDRGNDRPRDDRPRDDRQRDDRPRDERPRDDRPRDDRPRDDRPQNRDRNYNRDDRPRDDRPRDDRPREDRPRDDRPREDRPRDERPRDDRPREERPSRDRNFSRDDRPKDDRSKEDRPREDRPRGDRFDRQDRAERADPLAVVEPRATPLTPEAEPSAASPVLRSHDGAVSHAPAFLQQQPRAEPAAEAVEAAAPKPRKRRAPRAAEAADATPAAIVPSEDA